MLLPVETNSSVRNMFTSVSERSEVSVCVDVCIQTCLSLTALTEHDVRAFNMSEGSGDTSSRDSDKTKFDVNNSHHPELFDGI